MNSLTPIGPAWRPKPQAEPITKKNFFDRGMTFIQQNQMQIAAKLGSPEHEAWATYFRKHLDWTPAFLLMLEAGQIEAMTLPAQWPEWFDPDYQAAE